MSVYVGANGTEKILHLYEGSTTVVKTNVAGTSFHSSMPYMKVSSIHRFTADGTVPYNAAGLTTKGYASTTSVPLNSNCLVVGFDAGTRYFFQAQIDSPDWVVLPDTTTFGNVGAKGLCFGLDAQNGGYTASEDALPSKLVFEYIDVYVIDNVVEAPASEVKIDSTGIYINGSNVLTNQYVAFIDNLAGRVNDYDTILAIPHSNDIDPNSTAGGNFVTSTDNLTYTNQRTTGGHTLIQLINSYDFALQGVSFKSIGGVEAIGCRKNNVVFDLFSTNSHFFTATSSVTDHLVVAAHTAINLGTTLMSTLTVSLAVGQTLNVSVNIPSLTYTFKAFGNVPVVNGAKIMFRAAWEFFMYYVIDTAGTIKFYVVQSAQGWDGLTFSRDIRAYIRVLS